MSDFFSSGPGWGVLGAAVGAVIGWVVSLTKNSTQISALERRICVVEAKMDRLSESEAASDKQVSAALASVNTTLTGMAEILNKLDNRMTSLESRMNSQESKR